MVLLVLLTILVVAAHAQWNAVPTVTFDAASEVFWLDGRE